MNKVLSLSLFLSMSCNAMPNLSAIKIPTYQEIKDRITKLSKLQKMAATGGVIVASIVAFSIWKKHKSDADKKDKSLPKHKQPTKKAQKKSDTSHKNTSPVKLSAKEIQADRDETVDILFLMHDIVDQIELIEKKHKPEEYDQLFQQYLEEAAQNFVNRHNHPEHQNRRRQLYKNIEKHLAALEKSETQEQRALQFHQMVYEELFDTAASDADQEKSYAFINNLKKQLHTREFQKADNKEQVQLMVDSILELSKADSNDKQDAIQQGAGYSYSTNAPKEDLPRRQPSEDLGAGFEIIEK